MAAPIVTSNNARRISGYSSMEPDFDERRRDRNRPLRLLLLGGRQFTNWSNFVREAWLIKEKSNKRSCLKPPIDADERGCSLPFIGVNRRFPTLGGMRLPRYV